MLNSPVDSSVPLVLEALPEGLQVLRCPSTGGMWLRSQDYRNWVAMHPQETPVSEPSGADVSPGDRLAKRCPDDGRLLIRHRVGHGLPFHIDRCGACGGIWLDVGEWQALRSANLHDALARIVGSAWQARVLAEELAQARQRTLKQKLGESDYARTQEFVAFLQDHPQRDVILAWRQSRL